MEQKNEENLLCPIKYALNIFGGKWKLPVVCILKKGGILRYGQIKKRLGNITNVVLSQTLKELERDNIIDRKQYNEVPPKVEYSLTQNGEAMYPALEMMGLWSLENMKKSGICPDCKKCVPYTDL